MLKIHVWIISSVSYHLVLLGWFNDAWLTAMCHQLLVTECNVISFKILSYHRDKKFRIVNSHTHTHNVSICNRTVCDEFLYLFCLTHKTCSRLHRTLIIDVPNPPSVVTGFDFQIENFLRTLLVKGHRRLGLNYERCLGQTSFNVMLFSLGVM